MALLWARTAEFFAIARHPLWAQASVPGEPSSTGWAQIAGGVLERSDHDFRDSFGHVDKGSLDRPSTLKGVRDYLRLCPRLGPWACCKVN
jgi:hypothetical protein